MQDFIEIMEKIAKIDGVLQSNNIIATLRSTTQDLLGFRYES